MQELLQPLIHKAAVQNIAVNIARTDLSIGDEGELILLPDAQIGVFARKVRRLFGILPRRVPIFLGTLGPQATAILLDPVTQEENLRVRIVGLTPEHLAPQGGAPEIHISVWGTSRLIPTVQSPDSPTKGLSRPT